MPTYADTIASWLDDIEYRPDWNIRADADGVFIGGVVVTITAQVDDSRRPGRHATIRWRLAVPPHMEKPTDLYAWLSSTLLHGPEAHESAEWLRWRRNHRPVFDPHLADARQGAGSDGPVRGGDAGSDNEPTPATGPLDVAPSDGADGHDVGRSVPEPAPATTGNGEESAHDSSPDPPDA
jgi:hypothetical protein